MIKLSTLRCGINRVSTGNNASVEILSPNADIIRLLLFYRAGPLFTCWLQRASRAPLATACGAINTIDNNHHLIDRNEIGDQYLQWARDKNG